MRGSRTPGPPTVGLDVRLREPALVVDSPDKRAIETFARFVSQRGSRIPRGRDGAQRPRS